MREQNGGREPEGQKWGQGGGGQAPRHSAARVWAPRPHPQPAWVPGEGWGDLTPPASLGLQSCTMMRAQPGTCLPSLLNPSGPGHTCATGPYREGDLKVLPAQGALSLEGSGTGLHGSRSDPCESLGQASCQQGACQAGHRAGRPDPSPAGHLTGTGCSNKPGPPACPPPATGPPAPGLGVPPSGPSPGTGLGTDGPMWGAACRADIFNPWGQGPAGTEVPRVLPPPFPGSPVSRQDRHRRVQGCCPLSTGVSVGRTQDSLHALVSHPADGHTVS